MSKKPVRAGNGSDTVTVGAVGSVGNDQVKLGNGGADSVTVLSGGQVSVQVGNGNGDQVTVTGNGQVNVQVGNGNGDQVKVSYLRDGSEKTTTVTLGEG